MSLITAQGSGLSDAVHNAVPRVGGGGGCLGDSVGLPAG